MWYFEKIMDRLVDWTMVLIVLSGMVVIWGFFGYLLYSLAIGFLARFFS